MAKQTYAFPNCQLAKIDKKVGKPAVKVTFSALLPAAVARKLNIHSLVFETDNQPKAHLSELKVDIKAYMCDVRFQVKDQPDVLLLPTVREVGDFVVYKTGASKAGKVSKLTIKFTATYEGSAIPMIEFAEKWGSVVGELEMSPTAGEQADLWTAPEASPADDGAQNAAEGGATPINRKKGRRQK